MTYFQSIVESKATGVLVTFHTPGTLPNFKVAHSVGPGTENNIQIFYCHPSSDLDFQVHTAIARIKSTISLTQILLRRSFSIHKMFALTFVFSDRF